MSIAGQVDEDLELALRLSMQQHESPEAKRSKPGENSDGPADAPLPEESAEVNNRRLQRELMAAAAEKRMTAAKGLAGTPVKNVEGVKDVKIEDLGTADLGKGVSLEKREAERTILGATLSLAEADKLFLMIFGNSLSQDVLAQWSNQGVRFSADPETSMGLVQHEGGPCGVLAAIQAFVLKYLLFSSEDSASTLSMRRESNSESVASEIFSSLSEERKSRALVRSMSEILFLCGSNERAVIATFDVLDLEESIKGLENEVIAKILEGLSVESGHDLHKHLRVYTCTSRSSALERLEDMLPIFRSRMGALLFLISALLSRGLDNVQDDRDDPSLPLVTAPFGHASQEILNLLLSGKAAANVFDGNMDLGGGMFVKGITTAVEVGFLTLLESLNFCKVGQYLKCPKWPIWVVGSESHYTVLFALDTKVQEENELESRETQIRRAFDAQDQSGGGGFISVEGFHQVLKEANINLPQDKIEHLSNTGFIVWSEFWQVVLDLDKSRGGLKDSMGLLGKKVFDLYHFNGIAKSIPGSENPIQRPRLTKLRVSVPPRWTPEEYMAGPSEASTAESSGEVSKPPPPAQHAPLVDCVRTRWARAACNWDGDAPSIV